MVKLSIDLRFAMIAPEGFTARRYAELAINRMHRIPAEIRTLVLAELQASPYASDEDAINIAFQEISYLEEQLPRLESYGAVVVIYGVYEATLNRLPTFVLPRPVPSIRDYAGRSFLSQARRYYLDYLQVPLFRSGSDESMLRALADIRHCIAHANGHVAVLHARQRDRLYAAVNRYEGLTVVDGALTITPDFLLELGATVEHSLRALIKNLQRAHKRPPLFDANPTH